MNLVERTNSREEIDDCVVVFYTAVNYLREGDVEIVCVDSLVTLLRFGVRINGEELGGDGGGGHWLCLVKIALAWA